MDKDFGDMIFRMNCLIAGFFASRAYCGPSDKISMMKRSFPDESDLSVAS